MTFDELKQDLADKLREKTTATSPFWTTAWRAKILQDGANEFVFYTHCLAGKTVELNVVADQIEYNLNTLVTDFLSLSEQGKVIYQESSTNHTELYFKDINWLDKEQSGWRTADSSDPAYYYLRERQYLGIVPAGDTSITNGLELTYVPKPVAMTTGTSDPLDGILSLSLYHKAISSWAAAEGHRLREQDEESEKWMNHFMDMVKLFLAKNKMSMRSDPQKPNAIKVAYQRRRY